jgi:protein-tyrosine-phosphatase
VLNHIVAMAEAVFAHEAKLRGFEVEIDSAGEFSF